MASSEPYPIHRNPPSGRLRGSDFLEAPLRRPLLVCVPAVVALVGALTTAHLLPRRYRASVLVQAEWEKKAQEAMQRAAVDEVGRTLEAVRQRVLDRSAIRRVVEEVNQRRPRNGAAMPLAEQCEEMAAAVSVRPREKAMFLIEYVDSDPVRAALVPTRLARLLIEQSESERAARAQADPARVEARLNDARRVLEDKQTALRRAREEGASALTAGPSGSSAQLVRLDAEKRALAADLSMAQAAAQTLRQAIEDQNRPPAVESQPREELKRLRSQLADLRKRYTDEHPDVQALRRRIHRLETTLPPASDQSAPVSSWKEQLAVVDAQIEKLEQRKASLDAESAELLNNRSRRPRQPVDDLERLARDYEEAQKAYIALQDEWRAAETASRISRSAAIRFGMVRPATIPQRPYFPSRGLFAVVGLAFGLALGLGAAVVAELRDPSVKGPEDLQELLPQPLLATIPLVRLPRRGRRS